MVSLELTEDDEDEDSSSAPWRFGASRTDGFKMALRRLQRLAEEGCSSGMGSGSLNIELIPVKNSSIS